MYYFIEPDRGRWGRRLRTPASISISVAVDTNLVTADKLFTPSMILTLRTIMRSSTSSAQRKNYRRATSTQRSANARYRYPVSQEWGSIQPFRTVLTKNWGLQIPAWVPCPPPAPHSNHISVNDLYKDLSLAASGCLQRSCPLIMEMSILCTCCLLAETENFDDAWSHTLPIRHVLTPFCKGSWKPVTSFMCTWCFLAVTYIACMSAWAIYHHLYVRAVKTCHGWECSTPPSHASATMSLMLTRVLYYW